MGAREQLQDLERQVLVMEANIYDIKKELESMNKTVIQIKLNVTEALAKLKREAKL